MDKDFKDIYELNGSPKLSLDDMRMRIKDMKAFYCGPFGGLLGPQLTEEQQKIHETIGSEIDELEFRVRLRTSTPSPYPDLVEKLKRKWKSKLAAYAKNKANRAMKEQAIEYYEQNKHKYKSRRAAAKDMAGKIVHVKEDAVYRWLLRAKKNK